MIQHIHFLLNILGQKLSDDKDEETKVEFLNEINELYEQNFETYKDKKIEKASKFQLRNQVLLNTTREKISRRCHI